jgi:hypothetical protein
MGLPSGTTLQTRYDPTGELDLHTGANSASVAQHKFKPPWQSANPHPAFEGLPPDHMHDDNMFLFVVEPLSLIYKGNGAPLCDWATVNYLSHRNFDQDPFDTAEHLKREVRLWGIVQKARPTDYMKSRIPGNLGNFVGGVVNILGFHHKATNIWQWHPFAAVDVTQFPSLRCLLRVHDHTMPVNSLHIIRTPLPKLTASEREDPTTFIANYVEALALEADMLWPVGEQKSGVEEKRKEEKVQFGAASGAAHRGSWQNGSTAYKGFVRWVESTKSPEPADAFIKTALFQTYSDAATPPGLVADVREIIAAAQAFVEGKMEAVDREKQVAVSVMPDRVNRLLKGFVSTFTRNPQGLPLAELTQWLEPDMTNYARRAREDVPVTETTSQDKDDEKKLRLDEDSAAPAPGRRQGSELYQQLFNFLLEQEPNDSLGLFKRALYEHPSDAQTIPDLDKHITNLFTVHIQPSLDPDSIVEVTNYLDGLRNQFFERVAPKYAQAKDQSRTPRFNFAQAAPPPSQRAADFNLDLPPPEHHRTGTVSCTTDQEQTALKYAQQRYNLQPGDHRLYKLSLLWRPRAWTFLPYVTQNQRPVPEIAFCDYARNLIGSDEVRFACQTGMRLDRLPFCTGHRHHAQGLARQQQAPGTHRQVALLRRTRTVLHARCLQRHWSRRHPLQAAGNVHLDQANGKGCIHAAPTWQPAASPCFNPSP